MVRFIFILVLICSISVRGATYYVSNAGNDSNTGISIDQTWKTLQKVNSATFASGDQILFKRGDTFTGSITVQRSGISYGAYGIGNSPIISGFETITGWVSQGNGIYRATTNAGASCNMVTVNGVNTPIGRYPDSGWLTFESFSGRTSITDSQLTNTPNWIGAEVVIKKNNWTIDRSLITNHTNSTITYTSGSNYDPVLVDGSYSYFIQKDVKTLTTLGEWYCDGTYIYMYFGANNPGNYTVKTSVVSNIVTIDSKNTISIENLTFEGGNAYGVYTNLSSEILLSNCEIRFSGVTGIYGNSNTTITVDGCNINNSNGYGVHIISTGATLKNSTINLSGIYAGMGKADGASYSGINIRSTGGLIEYNKIINSGYCGIMFYNSNFNVRYNKVDGFCSLIADGGGIYTFVGNPASISSGQKVYNNIVINGSANGLYNDNASNNIEWYNNTVRNVDKFGFHSNFPHSVNVHDNTFYGTNGFSIQNGASIEEIAHDNIISQNTVVQTESDQTIFVLRDNGTWRVANFGISNNNRFYVLGSLTSTDYFYNMYVSPEYTLTYKNFVEWKTLTGKESITTLKTTILSNTYLAINETATASWISLPFTAKDLDGNYKGNQIFLNPYSSAVVQYSAPTNPQGWTKTRTGSNGEILVNSRKGNRVMVKQ